jgi:hypothetical protein
MSTAILDSYRRRQCSLAACRVVFMLFVAIATTLSVGLGGLSRAIAKRVQRSS